MNILILSHFFPPFNRIGALRTGYIADYLSRKNVKITVLKAADHIYGNNICQAIADTSPQYTIEEVDFYAPRAQPITAFLGYFSYKKALRRLLKKEKYDLVFMSGDPFFYFPLSKLVKKEWNLPCILDLRDPCYKTKDYFNNSYLKLAGRVQFEILNLSNRFNELYSFPYADKIINVTEELTEEYKRRHPEFSKKFCTILNGYDDRQVPDSSSLSIPEENSICVGIFGKFSYYNPTHTTVLAKSIKNMIAKGVNCKIITIGQEDQKLATDLAKLGISDVLESKGYLPYNEGMLELSKANVLMLNNFSHMALGTKIFDYIYLNRPIAAMITQDSSIANFLKPFNNACTALNEEELTAFFEKIHSNKITKLDDNIDIKNFSRQTTADQLLQLFNNVISTNN